MCDAHDVVGKIEGARVKDVIRAEQPHEVAFVVVAGGGKNFCSGMAGDLQCGNTDAARGAVDEHALAGAQVGQFHEGMPRRVESGGDGGGRFEGELVRFRNNRRGGGHGMARERGRGERDDLITRPEVANACTDGRDDAGALHAESGSGKAPFQGLVRQESHGIHHVAEVEAGGAGFDGHFTGAWRWPCAPPPAKM